MFTNVLVTLDGSQVAEMVLHYVLPFAQAARAENVTLLRVVEGDGVEDERAAASYLAERAVELRQAWSSTPDEAPAIETVAAPSQGREVATAIFEVTAERDIGVIMVSTRGWSGGDWWLTGSVAERVIKGAGVPVYAVRPIGGARQPQPEPIRRLLTPPDGSPSAEATLPYVERLAAGGGPAVTLVHAHESAANRRDSDAEDTDMADYLDSVVARLIDSGVSATAALRRGPAGQQISMMANEEDFDIVVMSSHGRTGAGAGAFGGVADRVLHGCHVPLLVIPARPVPPGTDG